MGLTQDFTTNKSVLWLRCSWKSCKGVAQFINVEFCKISASVVINLQGRNLTLRRCKLGFSSPYQLFYLSVIFGRPNPYQFMTVNYALCSTQSNIPLVCSYCQRYIKVCQLKTHYQTTGHKIRSNNHSFFSKLTALRLALV